MEFRLIVDSKGEDAKKIIDYAKETFQSKFVIITTNSDLKNEINKYENLAESVDDMIPPGTTQDVEAYEKAYEGAEQVRKIFSNIRYNDAEISLAFINKIRDELHFLERIFFVLNARKELNVILCSSPYNYYHFGRNDIAEIIGYSTQMPLSMQDGRLQVLDPTSTLYHRRIINTLYNIGNPSNPTQKTDQIDRLSFKFVSTKRPCLFLLQTNAADLYLKPIYPILEELCKNNYPYMILTGDSLAINNLTKKKIEFIDSSKEIEKIEIDESDVRKVIVAMKEIASRNDNSVVTILFRYLLNDAFYVEIVSGLKTMKYFAEVIDTIKPISVFVMPDGIDHSSIMCSVAKERGIKTVTTIAASVAPTRRSILPQNADIIAAYGDECVDAFLQLGYDSKRLVLTGNSYFDRIRQIKRSDVEENLLKSFKIQPGKTTILIATGSLDKNESSWMYEVIRYANRKNYQVIVKVHPAIDMGEYNHLKNNPENLQFHIIQDADILELLAVSDAVITDNSTAGILAILSDKPLLVANITGEPFPNNRYDEMGVALLASSVAEIGPRLDQIFTDKKTQENLAELRRKYQFTYNYKNDGNAASRIYELLITEKSKDPFRLIVDCKIEDAVNILEYAKKNFPSGFIIITNNRALKNELNKYSNHAKNIDDFVPTDSDQEIMAFERSFYATESIKEIFSNVKYENIEVTSTFLNTVRDHLNLLEIIHYILKACKEIPVILCLSYLNYYYFSYNDLAEASGYSIQLPLTIKEGNLTSLDPISVSGNSIICNISGPRNSPRKKRLYTFLSTVISKRKKIKKLESLKFRVRPCLFQIQTNSADLYLKPVYPLFEEFHKNNYPYLILTADSRAINNLSQRNIEFIDSSKEIEKIEIDESDVRKVIVAMKEIASRKDNSLVTVLFRYLLNDAFYIGLTSNLKIMEYFAEVIDTIKPISVFVMPDGIDHSSIMCSVAKERGIKTVTTIAASVAPSRRSIIPHSADIITSYGEECVNAFQQIGYDSKRLVLTGNPYFDRIKQIKIAEVQEKLSKSFKIQPGKTTILIATSGLDKNESSWMYEVIRYANRKNYQIIVKIHPDKQLTHHNHLENNPENLQFHIIQDADILELLAVSDVVITDYSNVGLLAILSDKPLLVANLTRKPFPNNRYDELGVATLSTSIEEIGLTIDKILIDEQTRDELRTMRKKYEYYYNYKNDGMAASRIYELLTKIQI